MSLQTSLLLGSYPVPSRSVRHHSIAVDLRKRPVGRRPVPSFLGPRAIPKPLHTRSYVPIRTGREGDPDTWPAIQIAGSACTMGRQSARVGRHYGRRPVGLVVEVVVVVIFRTTFLDFPSMSR